MEPAYLYILPVNMPIFRAYTINKHGRWYALSLDDAYGYGPKVTEYKTKKELKLLNITSLTFHYDLIDRLNVLFPGQNFTGYDENKLKCLLPLGLIDYNSQKEILNTLNIQIPIPQQNNLTPIEELLLQNMQNRPRLSEHSLDTFFVSVLEHIYGNHFDGYISPIKWPSKIHNGFFPREMFVFNNNEIEEVKEHLKAAPPTPGGGAFRNNDVIKHADEKINFIKIKIDKNAIKKISDKINKELNSLPPPTLFWNPHTEDKNTIVKGGKRNKTRKAKN